VLRALEGIAAQIEEQRHAQFGERRAPHAERHAFFGDAVKVRGYLAHHPHEKFVYKSSG